MASSNITIPVAQPAAPLPPIPLAPTAPPSTAPPPFCTDAEYTGFVDAVTTMPLTCADLRTFNGCDPEEDYSKAIREKCPIACGLCTPPPAPPQAPPQPPSPPSPPMFPTPLSPPPTPPLPPSAPPLPPSPPMSPAPLSPPPCEDNSPTGASALPLRSRPAPAPCPGPPSPWPVSLKSQSRAGTDAFTPPPSIPHTTATHLDALYVMHHARCRHRSGLFEWRSRRVQATTDRRDTAGTRVPHAHPHRPRRPHPALAPTLPLLRPTPRHSFHPRTHLHPPSNHPHTLARSVRPL